MCGGEGGGEMGEAYMQACVSSVIFRSIAMNSQYSNHSNMC